MRKYRECSDRAAVALLAEGVDRNSVYTMLLAFMLVVALLAEGVDRNYSFHDALTNGYRSPSSRRAWIEMLLVVVSLPDPWLSPSSRRAWIEISGA